MFMDIDNWSGAVEEPCWCGRISEMELLGDLT